MTVLVAMSALLLALVMPVSAQVVGQGSPAAMSDATAWPIKVVFGNTQIDPRLVTVQNVSLAVTGTFFQATQPVSLVDNASRLLGQITFSSAQHIVCDSGCAAGAPGQQTMAASSPVVIASDQSAVPVSGAFFQATQPVSGTVAATQSGTWTVQPGNTANTTAWKVDGSAVTQPVSGTFFQATQPVSIASMPSTPVTGTFFQATQPVSGTFWQATQPVSGTVTTTPPANASANIAQMAGAAVSMNTGVRDAGTQRVTIATNDAVPVTGTFFQATQPVSGTFFQATQPVSIASMPSTPVTGTFWQATQPVSGTVTANQGTANSAANRWPVYLSDGANTLPTMDAAARKGFQALTDGADTAQVTATGGGSLQVECAAGCGSAAASNLMSISVPRESVAAPTAATWYLKKQWALPANAVFTPTRAYSWVTTAGSETHIIAGFSLGTFNLSTNVFTDGGSVASPRSYGRLIGCVTTVQSAVATTITVTYTDELGGTGHTTAGAIFAASNPVGNCMEFVLAATVGAKRDVGVRDITAVSDTAAPTGVVEFFGVTTILDAQGQAAIKEWTDYDSGQLAAGEQIMILFKQAAVTAQIRGAGVTGAIR